MSENTNAAALVKASDTKVAIPDVNNIRALAKDLLDSGMFPGVKTVAGAVTIIQAGYELGVPPVASLNTMVIINGRLAMEAKLLLAIAANRVGVTWKILREDSNGCEIQFSRPGFSDIKGEFTREDAKKGNLLGKTNWNLYEKDMFFARAAGRGIKRIAPDAILGMVTKEEAEDFVDLNADPGPADFGADARTSELDELKKKIEGLTGAIAEAAKKPEDRAPLPRIKDEFDPGGLKPDAGAQEQAGGSAEVSFAEEIGAEVAKPGPEEFCSMNSVGRINELSLELAMAYNIQPSMISAVIGKKLLEKFNKPYSGEPADLLQGQAE
jgi:hypothetical protein